MLVGNYQFLVAKGYANFAYTTSAEDHLMAAVLYSALGASNTTSSLYTLDSTTGAATSVGPIGFALLVFSFDPVSSVLYGLTSNNSVNPRSVITVDINTGAGTLVAALSGLSAQKMFRFAIGGDGQMYGVSTFGGSHGMIKINKANGVLYRRWRALQLRSSRRAWFLTPTGVLWACARGCW